MVIFLDQDPLPSNLYLRLWFASALILSVADQSFVILRNGLDVESHLLDQGHLGHLASQLLYA